MLQFALQYRLDSVAFVMALASIAVIGHRWLRVRHGRGVPRAGWACLALLLGAGIVAADLWGEHQRSQLRDMIAGIAPTYAQEFELAGHSDLTLDTPTDDPKYLAMIAAQVRWERVNANVSDIYTLRRQPDGQLVFIVDSETDYDRDGRNDGELEQRTAIGEPYDEVTEKMLRTFDGTAEFDDVPETDRWGTWVSAYVPLRDANGRVEAILGIDYDARTWLTSIALNRATALGVAAFLSVILLASIIVAVITRAELAKRVVAEREREALQHQLVLASRQAGMAEVATSVLHNVGNVLNSVNVSAGIVTERLQTSKVAALAKATALIGDNRADIGTFITADERGKVLPDYLIKLAQVLSAERDAMLDELSTLTRSVDHIKQIVASQQSFARCADECETFDLPSVFEDAVRMNELSLERHGVQVVRKFAHVGSITADRHKVLQILVNLISNAKNAVKGQNGPKSIELRTELAERRDGQLVVRLVVADNGVGIKDEDVVKIFTHGFTTRKDGHGFGLHSAAIAAQQMKGTLSVASAGVGRGASFTIELPAASRVEAVAA